MLVFVAAGSPIPLYNTYRAQNGLTNGDLAVATAVYLVAAAVSLLVLGRLSDHLGRRAVGLGALISSALGLLVLLGVDGLPHLAAGCARTWPCAPARSPTRCAWPAFW